MSKRANPSKAKKKVPKKKAPVSPAKRSNKIKSQRRKAANPRSKERSPRRPPSEQVALIGDLLRHPKKYFEQLGLVGNPSYFLLLFLVMVSCRRSKPLSITVTGGSSSGKSYPIKRILQNMIPPKWVELTARFSEAVMQKFPRTFFQNRIVLIEEKCGVLPRPQYVIRILQSEGVWIDHLVGRDGAPKKQELIGPITVIDTTSDDPRDIKEDNLNRVLVVQTDESQDQTEKVMKKQAEEAKGGRVEHVPHFCQQVQDLLRRLVDLPVRISYAEKIVPEQMRAQDRRDFPKILHLVETVAYLRQFEKTVHKDATGKYIEADLEDYSIAHGMLELAFSVMRCDRDSVWPYYEALKNGLGSIQRGSTFKPADVRAITGLGRARSNIVIRDLLDLGLIEQVKAARSNVPGEYALVPGAEKSGSPLVHPSKLEKNFT